ncbi:cytochrome P450 [Streptomyces clavuligerus]|uniref:cytochrome P450 n=1 Tax=Streptomyces clavuligerus TaxID=1901 RepID=UPI0027DA6423|nr:cytochrome P450 [Streptomyces clavuligerus]
MTADPYPGYAWLREHDPVCPVDDPHAPGRMWLVTRYDDIRAVLGDPRFRPNGMPPGGYTVNQPYFLSAPGWLASVEGEEHARLRRLVGPAFSRARIGGLEPVVEQLTHTLLDALEKKGPPADLCAGLTLTLPSMVLCALLGIPHGDHDRVSAWTGQALIPPALLPPGAAERAHGEFTAYVAEQLARKRRDPAEDLLSDLAAAGTDGAIAEEEILGLTVGLLVAGLGFTTVQMEYGLCALLRHPDQLALLRSSPELMDGAVEELLRMFPPGHQLDGTLRYPSEDIEVGGVAIPAESVVLVCAQAAAFDPDRFDRPQDFDITRTANPHMSFGHGAHYCTGAPLARAELRTVFRALLDRFPRLALAAPLESLQVRMTHAGGFQELPITW